MFFPCVSERATVQVPTGLHSQTVVTGWSNYWVVDTPAWHGFISSRKRDSQITVYPHRAPSSGLIPQLQTGKPPTDTLILYSPMHAHIHMLKSPVEVRLPTTTGVFLLFIPHVCVCHHMPQPSPCFLSNTPTCTIKVCGMTALCRCVCEETEQQRESKRQTTAEYYLIYIPSLNNNSTLEDGSFDPLTHRCISHAATHAAKAGLNLSL